MKRKRLDYEGNGLMRIRIFLALVLSLFMMMSCSSSSDDDYISPENVYTLSVNIEGKGSVTPPGGDYEDGTVVELTATPEEGWEFSGWSGDLTGSDNPATITMDGNKSVTATFDIKTYAITVTAGDNGSISPTGDVVVDHGASHAFTITPDTGYHVLDVVVDSVSQGPLTEYTFTNVTVDHTISATFVRVYTLTVNTEGKGSVELDPPGNPPGTYGVGTEVKLTAIPDPCWEFSGWSGDLPPVSDNPVIITMNSDKNVTAVFTANPSVIESDDFNQNNLNTTLWTLVDPMGDATVMMVGAGTGDAQLEFSVPAGPSHDPYDENEAPRLLQQVNDTDFGVEVKFDSPIEEQYQGQGIIVEEDSDNWLRFDFYTTGLSTFIFSAITVNGTSEKEVNQAIMPGSPMYLRVERTGDDWTQSYSYDGVDWTVAVVFTHEMIVNAVGPFVANDSDSGENAPAHTAVIDYFFNMASPIDPEDDPDGVAEDTLPPLIQQIEYSVTPTTLDVTWITDEPASGTVEYWKRFEPGIKMTVEHPALLWSHVVSVTDLDPDTWYYFHVVSEDLAGNQSISEPPFLILTSISEAPFIDVWYGLEQRFGDIGIPQQWVNILGNVFDPDGVESLTYSLNGGTEFPLTIGPDDFRLDEEGDFNIEISIDDLNEGENQVVIRARDNATAHHESFVAVTVNYTSGNVWPETCTVDWSSSSYSDIEDAAQNVQIVDGLWTLEADSIRPVELGYDRLVAVGDMTWDNYEVTVPITIHAIETEFDYPPALGLIVRWQGHAANGNQPSNRWWPLGVMGMYRWYWGPLGDQQGYQLLGGLNNYIAYDYSVTPLEFEVQYIFKLRAVPIPGGSFYSLKVWPAAEDEPIEWTLVGEKTPDDQTEGSLVLVAHHVDASFGEVTITHLP